MSITIERPRIKRRFIMFPTPRILRIKNKVKEIEIIKPLFLFNRRTEVNKRANKKKRKTKKIITPGVEGSVRYINKKSAIKRKTIAKRVGK